MIGKIALERPCGKAGDKDNEAILVLYKNEIASPFGIRKDGVF